MIEYGKTKKGDILKIVGAGAPGYAANGDLVRVLDVWHNGVKVEDKHGSPCEFVYNCGAARVEPTEWREDFPTANARSQPERSNRLDSVVGLCRCPFCGGETEALHGQDEGGSRCLKCGSTGDTSTMIARNLARQRHEAERPESCSAR